MKKTKKKAGKKTGKKAKKADKKPKAAGKKGKPGKKKDKAAPPDLDTLRKPVEKAKAAHTAAEVEAQTLEGQAREVRAKAKDAFRDALAPYREACRKAHDSYCTSLAYSRLSG